MQYNRIVVASVRLKDIDIARGALIEAMRDDGWKVPVLDESQPGSAVKLLLPIYCARAAALPYAREKLLSYSKVGFRLNVDEIRLVPPVHPWVRSFSVFPRKTILAGRLRWPAELTLWRNGWEVHVPRTQIKSRDEREAKLRLWASQLPGERFDQSRMGLVSPIEPSRVRHPARIGIAEGMYFFVAAILVMAIGICGAAVGLRTGTPDWLRGVSLIASLVAGVFAGFWVTGDDRSPAVRWGMSAVLVSAFVVYGISFRNFSLDVRATALVVGATALTAAVLGGWIHLARIVHTVSRLASIALISAMVVAAASCSRLILESIANSYGIPGNEITWPLWLEACVAALLLMAIGALCFVVGGLAGYFSYYRIAGSSRAITILFFAFSILVMVLYGSMGAWAVRQSVRSGAEYLVKELDAGRTPELSQSMVYQACLRSVDSSSSPAAYVSGVDVTQPQVVVRGRDGGSWVIAGANRDEGFFIPASAVVADRVPDGSQGCPVQNG